MPADPHRPVVVGVGQLRANRERTVEGAREPLELLLAALRSAEADAGVAGLLARADDVSAVRVASWAYDGLAQRVASAVGAAPRTLVDTGLGGHLPVRLLDEAAARVARGESEVALLVGGEAQASVTLLGKQGVDPVGDLGWSAAPGGPPAFDLDELGSAAMQAAGLVLPARVYPLYENRLQAQLGLTPEQGARWSAELYAALSRTAAGHEAAWERDALTPEQVGEVAERNRMVCEPYPLRMNAMPHVDQAAALVVTSERVALEAGVPAERLVSVVAGAGADDHPDVLARPDLGDSAPLALALRRALELAGAAAADLALVDAYSCFPVVPKLVGRALGLPADADLSVTGGHSAFGGPLNSYCVHALATAVQRLRGTAGTGLVHGNGGYLTHQHAVVLSGRPAPYAGDPVPVAAARPGPQVVALDGEVDATVETATVEHDRAGRPSQAFVVAALDGGRRVAVQTPPGDEAAAAPLSLASLGPGETTHVGRRVRLRPLPGGTAVVSPA